MSDVWQKTRLQCAGLNRHEAEEEKALRERTSDSLGPSFALGIVSTNFKAEHFLVVWSRVLYRARLFPPDG
jgi:hypothetical protein